MSEEQACVSKPAQSFGSDLLPFTSEDIIRVFTLLKLTPSRNSYYSGSNGACALGGIAQFLGNTWRSTQIAQEVIEKQFPDEVFLKGVACGWDGRPEPLWREDEDVDTIVRFFQGYNVGENAYKRLEEMYRATR